jgi:hypothetical protein
MQTSSVKNVLILCSVRQSLIEEGQPISNSSEKKYLRTKTELDQRNGTILLQG